MIIDHFGIGVSDYGRAKTFYSRALAPLGITLLAELGPELTEGNVWAGGYGCDGKPEFWIGSDGKTTPPIHVAFVAGTRAEVRAFHAAALLAGGRDNGAPGIRAQYHPSYYAAFVLDDDGHNVEVVCHAADE